MTPVGHTAALCLRTRSYARGHARCSCIWLGRSSTRVPDTIGDPEATLVPRQWSAIRRLQEPLDIFNFVEGASKGPERMVYVTHTAQCRLPGFMLWTRGPAYVQRRRRPLYPCLTRQPGEYPTHAVFSSVSVTSQSKAETTSRLKELNDGVSS